MLFLFYKSFSVNFPNICFLLSFDSANKFAIAITSRQSKLFLLKFVIASELNHAGNIVYRIEVLTLLAIENILSAVALEARFTAKILHILQIFKISFLSVLPVNLISLIILWTCSISLSLDKTLKVDSRLGWPNSFLMF